MTQEKYTLKRNRFLFIIALFLFVYSCKSQGKENPATLGSSNFDLEKMTFKEDINTLLGTHQYYKTSIKDGNSAIAYNYIISKKQNKNIKVSLGSTDISRYKYDFKVSKDNEIIGVSVSFVSKEDIKDVIIKDMEKQYNKYRIDINQLYDNPALYRWQTPDKIIQVAYSFFEGDHVYAISLVNKNFDCSRFPLEKVFVGEDICLKKYKKK